MDAAHVLVVHSNNVILVQLTLPTSHISLSMALALVLLNVQMVNMRIQLVTHVCSVVRVA